VLAAVVEACSVISLMPPWPHAQVAQDWGWNVVDAVAYVSIAPLYGREYAVRKGGAGGAGGSVFARPQPEGPAASADDGEAVVQFGGDHVRVVTGVLAQG
jgi:hypothetical protein